MKGQKPPKGRRPPHMERVYVKVNSDFDATGYMQPRSITWADGRTFKIEAVKDYRPAACYRQGAEGSCYTVITRFVNLKDNNKYSSGFDAAEDGNSTEGRKEESNSHEMDKLDSGRK